MTEIFATFGPSCRDEEILRNMVAEGLTGMRLNLSHMTLPQAADYINAYRSVADAPKILIDMQGPELRVGKADIELEGTVDINTIQLPKAVLDSLETGDEILLDDGKLLLHMTDKAHAETVRGGFLKSHKSVKIKNKNIDMPVLTDHDIENIRLAKDYGVTAVMQPFVRSGDDLKKVRDILNSNGAEHIDIYAKIENRQGVENLSDILPYADALVIARGDLGNDMPLWELPRVQKRIEDACHKADKPYIVVTQMLASMEHSPVPTRAEVSDVATAVYDGADTVMLSAETAAGAYPVEAVKMMNSVITQVESDPLFFKLMENSRLNNCCSGEADSITFAASDISSILKKVACIVTYTSSGLTTFLTARERPNLPILAITSEPKVADRLGIVWGAKSFVNKESFKSFDKIEDIAVKIAVENGFARSGDHIIITAGFPLGKKGRTNMLHTVYVE